jgi:hypothetical protein
VGADKKIEDEVAPFRATVPFTFKTSFTPPVGSRSMTRPLPALSVVSPTDSAPTQFAPGDNSAPAFTVTGPTMEPDKFVPPLMTSASAEFDTVPV